VQQSVLRALGDARQSGGRRVLAVSGGIDSMVLLHAAAAAFRALVCWSRRSTMEPARGDARGGVSSSEPRRWNRERQ
jgi:PP-loop superfamily ATP-utilizing enzyme